MDGYGKLVNYCIPFAFSCRYVVPRREESQEEGDPNVAHPEGCLRRRETGSIHGNSWRMCVFVLCSVMTIAPRHDTTTTPCTLASAINACFNMCSAGFDPDRGVLRCFNGLLSGISWCCLAWRVYCTHASLHKNDHGTAQTGPESVTPPSRWRWRSRAFIPFSERRTNVKVCFADVVRTSRGRLVVGLACIRFRASAPGVLVVVGTSTSSGSSSLLAVLCLVALIFCTCQSFVYMELSHRRNKTELRKFCGIRRVLLCLERVRYVYISEDFSKIDMNYQRIFGN